MVKTISEPEVVTVIIEIGVLPIGLVPGQVAPVFRNEPTDVPKRYADAMVLLKMARYA
jgi:hypothetical protein